MNENSTKHGQSVPSQSGQYQAPNPVKSRGAAKLLRPKPLLIGVAVVVVLAIAAVVVVVSVAGGFGSGPNRFVFSSGFDRPAHVKHDYRTFVGLVRRDVTVEEGQALDVTYGATVNKGSLSIEVKDPTGHDLWRVNVPDEQQTNGTKSLVAEQTGSYVIVITGLDTGGSFDVFWDVQPAATQS